MDYVGILKRAWKVTWKYKILWLFGLFAGAGGSNGNFNSNYGGNSGRGGGGGTGTPNTDALYQQVQRAVEQNLPLLVAIIVFAALVALVFFVLSFAAQGGLVHLVNEAEEGRPVRGGDGWSVGFKRWGRVFLLDFLIGLPILALTLVFVVMLIVSLGGVGALASLGKEAASGAVAGIATAAGGACCGILIFSVLAFAMSVVLGIVAQLALRYAIIEDRAAWASIKQGWADLWARRGAFVMYLVMVVVGIVVGIVIGVAAAIMIAPAVVFAVLGNWAGFGLLAVVAIFALMLPSAIYGAFISAVWTIFFRRMTGKEAPPAVGVPLEGVPGAPAAPAAYAPPVETPAAPPADPWKGANDVPDAGAASGLPPAPPMPVAPPMPEPPPMPEAPGGPPVEVAQAAEVEVGPAAPAEVAPVEPPAVAAEPPAPEPPEGA